MNKKSLSLLILATAFSMEFGCYTQELQRPGTTTPKDEKPAEAQISRKYVEFADMLTGEVAYGVVEFALQEHVASRNRSVLDVRRIRKSEFDLRGFVEAGADIIVDDYQYSEFELRRLAQACCESGGRLHVIDFGNKSEFELQRIGEAGACIYSSDPIRRSEFELGRIAKACLNGGGRLLYVDNSKLLESELRRMAEAGAWIEFSPARSKSEIERIIEKVK